MDILLTAASTKGPEYIIAVIGLLAFLFFLALLKPASRQKRASDLRRGAP